MKKCNKCETEKMLDHYSKKKDTKDGYSSVCKECHSKYRKNNYIINKEKVVSQVNLYKINHPEKYINKKKYNKSTFSKKDERILETKCFVCGKTVYATKKEVLNNVKKICSIECKQKTYLGLYYHYLNDIKKRAVKTKKEFDLTEGFIKDLLEVKQDNKCKITNLDIHVKRKHEKTTLYDTASLDRIDSNKGYTINNVQWVCLGINYMKLNFSEEELHKTLRLIKEKYV